MEKRFLWMKTPKRDRSSEFKERKDQVIGLFTSLIENKRFNKLYYHGNDNEKPIKDFSSPQNKIRVWISPKLDKNNKLIE